MKVESFDLGFALKKGIDLKGREYSVGQVKFVILSSKNAITTDVITIDALYIYINVT
jgi:hypothetical protein